MSFPAASVAVKAYIEDLRHLGNALREVRAKAQADALYDAIQRGQAPKLLEILRKHL